MYKSCFFFKTMKKTTESLILSNHKQNSLVLKSLLGQRMLTRQALFDYIQPNKYEAFIQVSHTLQNFEPPHLSNFSCFQ